MHRLFTLFAALLMACATYADGGMWWLQLMEQQHLADSLRAAGLRMNNDELLRLRDCVGQFGGGCTAEVISHDGLIMTNNHCGYSYVHAMSTLEQNYLKDGYFAKSREEEIQVPRLTFSFVVDIEEVTEEVKAEAKRQEADAYTMQSRRFLRSIAEKMQRKTELKEMGGVSAEIVSFYGGNRFYAIYTQTFRDVRLVVNPPLNVAQFGGDGDNWVWPRHNPDFAIFRVYATSEGKPADYSQTNVPLHRDRCLPISLKGYEEGDFSMIMGFPGSTSRYLSASQLKNEMENVYRPIVLAGEPQLEWERDQMELSDSMRLAMQDDHMGLQNMVKNFGGALKAVERTRLVDERRAADEALTRYGREKGDKELASVVRKLDELYATSADTLFDFMLYHRTLGTDEERRLPGELLDAYYETLRKGDINLRAQVGDTLLKYFEASISGFDRGQNASRMAVLLPIWADNCRLESSKNLLIANFEGIMYQSIFRSKDTLKEFLRKPTIERWVEDPIWVQHISEKTTIREKYLPCYMRVGRQEAELSRTYQRGLMEMNGWSTPPDANFTQRLTYGHVKAYSPRDAVRYDYRTFLGGMFEKESKTDPDYAVNPRVRELYDARQFGTYANKEGRMQTDFLTDNDITGGNSGSPVLNARGEIIGVAFDGNIESLSSDFKYDPQMQRCINADIRYVLWTLDTFGGSSYILPELDLRR